MSNASIQNQTPLIYPNPVKEILYLESTLEKGDYLISNIAGQIIKEGYLSKQITMEGIQRGIYIFTLKSENGLVNHRFMKE